MVVLKLLIFLLPLTLQSTHAQYECGAHGRFEYCIDGIPGCVVGCHCHPGYYFDTDTKICEPNTKLAQVYGHQNALQPTRIQNLVTSKVPAAFSVEKKVDAITNDTSDISDWLYNQFFKTIENEVINNTKGVARTEFPFRRSGGKALKMKEYKRKSKSKRKTSKHKKSLRRKLLKISPDDSLFDESASSSEERSSSSAESSGESSDSDDSRHGHRELLVYNRTPKPLLPPFIFLPNVGPSFYPPLGLPPPPVIPMQPIIPVPPMFPFVVTTANTSSVETTTAPPTTTSTTEAATITDLEKESEKPVARNKAVKARRERKFQQLQRQRDRQQKKNKIVSPSDTNYMDELETPLVQEAEASLLNSLNEDSSILKEELERENQRDDVDLKYLSQLIHKSDLVDKNLKTSESELGMLGAVEANSRRRINPMDQRGIPKYYGIRRNLITKSNSEDAYYTSIGKQIANLIRNMKSKEMKNIPNEPMQLSQKSPTRFVFHENPPRSYWERSVRSAIKLYGRPFNDKLSDIEDRVKYIATTTPALSLQDIENIVNFVENKNIRYNDAKIKSFRAPNKIKIWEDNAKVYQNNLSEIDENANMFLRGFDISRNEQHSKARPNKLLRNKMTYEKPVLMAPKNNTIIINQRKPIRRNHIALKIVSPGYIDAQANVKHSKIPAVLNPPVKTYYSKQYKSNIFSDEFANLSNDNIKGQRKNRPPSYFHHEFHHFDYFS